MQGISGGGGGNNLGEPTRMQLVALTTGTSSPGRVMPIIGPPMISRSVSGKGWLLASSACSGVPISAS